MKNKKTKTTRSSKKKSGTESKQPMPSVHTWRICPYGEHWVRTHPMQVPPSKTNPEGCVTTRHEHCACNPSGKDQLYPEEIQEVLKPDEPLDPNLIKALIASESGFDPNQIANKKNSNSARGLMQITNETRKLLDGYHGDLKDHLITVTKAELNDANVNICAGVRWLFEKRRQTSIHLKRPSTWVEAVWEYKGVKLAKTKQKADNMKKIFNDFYEEFQKCGQS